MPILLSADIAIKRVEYLHRMRAEYTKAIHMIDAELRDLAAPPVDKLQANRYDSSNLLEGE